MAGLIFLAALAASLWLCVWLSKTVGNLMPNPAWRSSARVGIFLALLASPFVDEVIGKYQFEALCKANGIESADVSKARGKRVVGEYVDRRPLGGLIMPMNVSNETYKDADTGDVLIQYNDYFAFGGWLMRYTPISMGSHTPMLFDGNGCGFSLKKQIFLKNQILQIN